MPDKALTVGSLFSGIGGFDLGLERAGFDIKWQVEIDPYCSAVLAKHWPEVRRYTDVRETHVADTAGLQRTGVSGEICRGRERRDGSGDGGAITGCAGCLAPVDVICGGFPCQPHSLAGRRAGADDERDLWPDFARVIRELRPRWVVAENVPGLLSTDAGRFFGGILRDLAELGYDAEWHRISAADMGAPHLRERIWIVAYPHAHGGRCEVGGEPEYGGEPSAFWREPDGLRAGGFGHGSEVADAASGARQWAPSGSTGYAPFSSQNMADANGAGCLEQQRIFTTDAAFASAECRNWWRTEPGLGRVAHGVSNRVDRLKGLGNALIPAIPEWIGRQILAWEVTHAG